MTKVRAYRYLLLLVFLVSSSAAQAQTLIIPQIVDGGAWQTTLVLTNTTAAAATANMSFFEETTNGATQPWVLSFLEGGTGQSLAIPAGGTLFLHTSDTASTTSVGWAQVQAGASVVAYAIFTQRVPGRTDQDGTSTAAASSTRVLVPFDNTNSFATSMAIANPTSASETVAVGIRTASGTVSAPRSITLPAQGHSSFTFATQFPVSAGVSGLAEFYVSSGSISILALRFNPTGSFTTAPVYAETGPPIINTSSGGGTPAAITYAPFDVQKATTAAGFPPSAGLFDTIGGEFSSFSSTEWAIPLADPTFGMCNVLDETYPTGGKDPANPDSYLDAGIISVSGPGLPQGTVLTKTAGATGPTYSTAISPGTLTLGGTYTITGAGGTQVGPFTISATLPSSFSVPSMATTTLIDRTQTLDVSWTGSGFNQIIIQAIGSATVGSNTHAVTVDCPVASSLGTYTIPSAALALLPATAQGRLQVLATNSSGATTITPVSSTSQQLTPSLVAGGNVTYGSFSPVLTVVKTLTIQ